MSNQSVVTPNGDLEWVFIDGEGKPDLQGNPTYSANLVLDGAQAEKLKAKLDEFWANNKPAGFTKEPKSMGYYAHTVTETQDGEKVKVETGKTLFAFKTKTTYQDGSPKKIDVYNAKAQKISLGSAKIGNGSKGAISGAMGIYEVKGPNKKTLEAGVTLYLNAIQLTHFVAFSQDAGFGVSEEGSFEGLENDGGFAPAEEAQEETKEAARPRL